ncbi:hypothetical protein HK100_006783, partial [Physocladia obscura]
MASAIIEPISTDEEMGEADGSDNKPEMINAVANSASHKGKTKAIATHTKSILKQQSGKTHKGGMAKLPRYSLNSTDILLLKDNGFLQNNLNSQCAMALIANENLSMRIKKVDTILDSGASVWMTPNKDAFIELQLIAHGSTVVLVDDSEVPILGHGTIKLNFHDVKRIVENALFVPDLTEALGSITSLVNAVYFHTDSVYLRYHDTGKDVLIGTRVGDLFYLPTSDHTSKDPFAESNPRTPGSSSTGEDSNDKNSVGSAISRMNVSKTSKLIKSSQSNHVPYTSLPLKKLHKLSLEELAILHR